MNKFMPFALPDIGLEEIAAVTEVLQSGWITTGKISKKFEADFSNFLGCDVESLSVNSATAGLHLALEALGVGPGDEVITTTHTFTATAEVVRYLGATPVFVDIDPQTLCISVDGIREKISSRTKVILPVHFGGLAADITSIGVLAKEKGIFVVEDAAHALPSTHNGKLVGTLESDITVFSFYANKTMTTGEGGMVVTRNKKLAERMRIMRLHGISRDAFDRFTSKTPSWYYEVIAPGFKYNLTDLASAIGVEQLKKVNGFQARREAVAEFYKENLKGLPVSLPPYPKNNDVHSWHLYPIFLDESFDRNEIITSMFNQGIGCSVHYIPLHLQPYWRDEYRLKKEDFPVSQALYESTLSIPIYSKMDSNDSQRVVNALKVALGHA